jgi:hypothetical protein
MSHDVAADQRSVARSLAHGTLVIVGGGGGDQWPGGIHRQLRAMALSPSIASASGRSSRSRTAPTSNAALTSPLDTSEARSRSHP